MKNLKFWKKKKTTTKKNKQKKTNKQTTVFWDMVDRLASARLASFFLS